MDALTYKTLSANKKTAQKKWLHIDAANHSLGRLCSVAAKLLRGKHKPNFTPHVDCGDYLVITNASKIKLTGKKWTGKIYLRHSGYPGGQKSLTAQELFDKDPIRLIEKAVKGMLPKNKLGAQIFRNLKVFAGDTHNHAAQSPKTIDVKDY